MTRAKEIIQYMESLRNEEQRRILMRFFKTGPGEYGYGDEFLGLKMKCLVQCFAMLLRR